MSVVRWGRLSARYVWKRHQEGLNGDLVFAGEGIVARDDDPLDCSEFERAVEQIWMQRRAESATGSITQRGRHVVEPSAHGLVPSSLQAIWHTLRPMEARSHARLRQAVLVAEELEPVETALREALGLGTPFRDPAVAEFGLVNAVFALGDCFLEVISPQRAGTAAGRYLARHGDGGYMAIFDLEDLDGARARARGLGIRVAWEIDLPDISGTHLHPADMRGAIVSLDQSRPAGTWRWGGPEWTGRIGHGAPGRLAGVTVAVPDPAVVATRWANVLGATAQDDGEPTLALDGAKVCFADPRDVRGDGLVEIAVELPPAQRGARTVVEVGGVRMCLTDGT